MLLQPICGFNTFKQSELIQQHNNYGLKTDLPITFKACTTAGNPFRKLRNVPDAFFGGPTIRSSDINAIKNDILNCHTVKQSVKYLKNYKNYMLKTEKSIFERFENAAKNSSHMQFQDLLKQWYDEAIIKLKLEEFAVIDEIDRISLQLSPETTFAIRKETTNCRKIIIDNNPHNQFKRKTVLGALESIPIKQGEEKIMKRLMEKASYLPTSATSENAFIVKYINRSHNEISNRLVTPSVLTIDHILAASKGGSDDISNFIPVSAGANVLKEDMLFKKFIIRFPQVIENCQKFIDFMIDIINKGGFKGNQAYPYKIEKRLIKESGGKVKLDLSALKYSEEDAKKFECETKKNKKITRAMLNE